MEKRNVCVHDHLLRVTFMIYTNFIKLIYAIIISMRIAKSVGFKIMTFYTFAATNNEATTARRRHRRVTCDPRVSMSLNRDETQFSSRLDVFPVVFDVMRLQGYYFVNFGFTAR